MKKNILFLFLIGQVILASAQQVMTPEFLWKLARVSDPQVSPSGTMVVYSVTNYNLARNKGNKDIWVTDLSTGISKAIASDSTNEFSPRWSSDGLRIYFLSDAGGSSQLWSMTADGKARQRQSELNGDINAFGISPSGASIWVAMDVQVGKVKGSDVYSDLPKATGRVYDDLMMRHWDQWNEGIYSHLFIGKFEDGLIGTLTDIMKDEPYDVPMKPHGGDEQICWSPDGNTIAYTCKKSAGREYATTTNSDIYLYDVARMKTTNLTEGMAGYDKDPKYSPDGTRLVWISQAMAGNEADRTRLFCWDISQNTKRELSVGFDQNVENTAWSMSGQVLYFLSPIAGTQQVYSYDFRLKSALPVRQITKDTAEHVEISVSWIASEKMDVIVTSRSSLSSPIELFNIDLRTGESKPITSFNTELLRSVKLARVEKRMVRSTDGKEILTWVVLPPDFSPEKKYPALLYCQGGPQSMVGQVWSYRWNMQLMAANGYVVVAPNRRGLPGFGSEWNDAISGDWGGQAMKDLLSAIDSVSNESFVDKNKLGAVGASFGGYSVYWLAGNHNKRFKAFISHNGVYNMRSMSATEELFFYRNENAGYPWETPMPKSYVEFSPDNFVKNWNTPILIIANERDYRVPYTQGLEAYTAARTLGVPARFLSYPDENHWVLRPQNSVMWQRVFFDWLDRYLK